MSPRAWRQASAVRLPRTRTVSRMMAGALAALLAAAVVVPSAPAFADDPDVETVPTEVVTDAITDPAPQATPGEAPAPDAAPQQAGAPDAADPVFDTSDGKAPWIKVSLPPDHTGPYLYIVPFTIESNSPFLGSSNVWIDNDIWVEGKRLTPNGVLTQTFELEPFYEGRMWIYWDLRTQSGGRYAGSTYAQVEKSYETPIVWKLPARTYNQGEVVQADYDCRSWPGYRLIRCGAENGEPEYLYTGAKGERRFTAQGRYFDEKKGEEFEAGFQRRYIVGDPIDRELTAELVLEQQSWETGEWAPLDPEATPEIVDGNPLRAKVVTTNNGSDPQNVRLSLQRPDYAGNWSQIPGGAAAVDIEAKKTRTEYFPLDTTLLAWKADGTAQIDPEKLMLSATGETNTVNDQVSYLVVPRPVILVHGYKSNAASSWGNYQQFLTAAHPKLRGWAVGDGQVPGVLNTGSEKAMFARTNTVAENAAQEALYIEGVRRQTGAWSVDIVAHSMGGLISRYYLQELMPMRADTGEPIVNRLIQLGTPNRGSQLADMLLSFGILGSDKIPLYPATLQLSTRYNDSLFNKLITTSNGVPVSNLVGTDLPLAGMPVRESLFGDSIVPAYSARWNLVDTYDSPYDLHTAMTENPADFTNYVLPRLNGQAPRGGGIENIAMRAAAPLEAADADAGEADAVQVEQVHTVTLPAGGSVELDATIGSSDGFGVLTTALGVEIELVDPDGNVQANSAWRPQSGVTTAVNNVNPAAGTWKVVVRDTTGEAREVPLLFMVAGSTLLVVTAADQADDGRIRITAKLTDGDAPVLDATAYAVIPSFDEVSRAAGGQTQVVLLDDGKGADAVADDGIYTGVASAMAGLSGQQLFVQVESDRGSRIASPQIAAGWDGKVGEPGGPGDPGDPGNPGDPGDPGNPDEPGRPEDPRTPGHAAGAPGSAGSGALAATGVVGVSGWVGGSAVLVLLGLLALRQRARARGRSE
ncbi:MAG: hypothetical protein DI534_13470 [Leifsonia xyli]|nr:MAG: hypothetical protein DI534_13470 [Leifsonia xyli]